MNKFRILILTLMVMMLLASVSITAHAQQWNSYSNSELDEILAPIALYPDPLIAQILPAATYLDQLEDADYLVSQGIDDRDIDEQYWDVSVKALAYYPSVLRMMVDRPEWTISLGQAYVDDPYRVMISIQRLRNKARSYGYLSTNNYQRVYLDSSYIRIVPVQARYIFVPRYNPQVVYVQRRSSSSSNLISFGLGLLIGSWLNRDCDWGHNRIYYHGWSGNGWINNSRSHINITNNYYINNNYRNKPIQVDHRIRSRDIGDYRLNVRKNAGTFRLPESRQPNRSNDFRNRDSQQSRTSIRQTVPRSDRSGDNSNTRPNQGVNRRSQTGRDTIPSVTTKPRVRPDDNSNARSSQGVNRRNQTDRSNTPSVRTEPSIRLDDNSNARPSQGVNRRNQNDRSNAPSVRTEPRVRPDDNSNARSSQGVYRRNQNDRSNAPSVRTEPRVRPDDNSNARS
ncbi:MAG: DUF3300 domain-containing protein, partial [Armatimonadota bacterium]